MSTRAVSGRQYRARQRAWIAQAHTVGAEGGQIRSTICGIGHIFFYQIILDLETHLKSLLKSPLELHPHEPNHLARDLPEDVLRIDLETICTVITLVMLHLETMLETPKDTLRSPKDNSEYLITIC